MSTPRPLPTKAPPRLRVERVTPSIDDGRYPVRRTLGESLVVGADVIRDGHEVVRASLRWKGPNSTRWHEAPMFHVDGDAAGVRWEAELPLDALGAWTYTVRAWTEPLASWREELARRAEGALATPNDASDSEDIADLASALTEGASLMAAATKRSAGADRVTLADATVVVADPTRSNLVRVAAALEPETVAAADRHPDLTSAAPPARGLTLIVEPELARFGAWYELFPRSWGGLAGVRRRLPAFAELGFDVLYMPPIHPIGVTNRKGPNNALAAGSGDPGSPWAIGDAGGGHAAIHPGLGTAEDLRALVAEARSLGMEIALDLAIQCSADHPWLTEHPDWFFRRPDGTIKYAENPPKKYQDIYNLDFDCADWQGLWEALLAVTKHWIDQGVKVFRVDNPHTKPLPFWEWLIASVHDEHPDVIFLAEAFTKRRLMQALAKSGFSQSYTYFTWKTSKHELTEYLNELANTPECEYFRPNFFTNTPDILSEQLQNGGPPTFVMRLLLAATLSPTYGIYSGYESFEALPVAPGSEEYLDSEKYQTHDRSLDGPLLALICHLNVIRRAHPPLQHLGELTFLETRNDCLIAYAKRHGSEVIICVINLDPHTAHEGSLAIPSTLGLPDRFGARDLLTNERFDWLTGDNYVRLVPGERPAHIIAVEP